MVRILPGYPKMSPEDPLISLLALYLQLPQGFSDNVVGNDVLKAIVESDVSRIEGSIGGTILSVEFLLKNSDTTDKSDEESEPALADYVIGAASVCCGLLLVMICTLALGRKRCNSRRTKTADNNYNNDAYYTGSGEQAIEIKCDDRTCLSGNVADIKPGEHSC
ncbi:hypothetical protein ACROYT_G001518 [Oculina patagonica]